MKENDMPVINIGMHKVSDQVKADLIRRVTDVSVEVTGVPADRFTILINELEDTNIGCAGKTLKEIKASR